LVVLQAAAFSMMSAILSEEWIFLCVIPVVMLARVYFGFHWLGDTLGGASIGVAIATAVFFFSQLVLH
jgi:membrane-associated phospholipid phosphatase